MANSEHLPSEVVIHTVADARDTDPLDLPPLYNAIDPEALDTAVDTTTTGEITFDYAGFTITVTDTTEVTLVENRSTWTTNASTVPADSD